MTYQYISVAFTIERQSLGRSITKWKFVLQGIFLMYMYVGSIAVIIGIYIWVLVDSCSSMHSGATGLHDAELGGASLTRFGSLKRAHISRSRTAPTSFYIRVGALRK